MEKKKTNNKYIKFIIINTMSIIIEIKFLYTLILLGRHNWLANKDWISDCLCSTTLFVSKRHTLYRCVAVLWLCYSAKFTYLINLVVVVCFLVLFSCFVFSFFYSFLLFFLYHAIVCPFVFQSSWLLKSWIIYVESFVCKFFIIFLLRLLLSIV